MNEMENDLAFVFDSIKVAWKLTAIKGVDIYEIDEIAGIWLHLVNYIDGVLEIMPASYAEHKIYSEILFYRQEAHERYAIHAGI